jgi:PAS domain S-box-containing protein
MTTTNPTGTDLQAQLEKLRNRNAELGLLVSQLRLELGGLKSSETIFRSIAESAIDAIVSTDSDDKIIFWNKAAEKMFGYSRQEVLGRSVSLLIPERYLKAHKEGIANYLSGGAPKIIGKTVELQGVKKGGEEAPIELSLSDIRTQQGFIFSGIIRDITDRKESDVALERRSQEARERSEELESLIQMVAHDLKSPVITIVGLVRLLQKVLDKASKDATVHQLIGQIWSSAESMESFLKDLMDGLVVSGTEPIWQEFSLNAAIEQLVQEHRQSLSDNGISLEMSLGPNELTALGDQHRIRQVLDNLITNAIRHGGNNSNRKITIEIEEIPDYIVTSVSDNGKGIPAQYHSRIFERFFRVPGTPKGTGTGLGLFIVKKIVDSHKGRVWVESVEGQGTTLRFSLPKIPLTEKMSTPLESATTS